MSLPPAKRVIYKKNPLTQVLCELKFMPILAIDANDKSLADFQDRIRSDFPLYQALPFHPSNVSVFGNFQMPGVLVNSLSGVQNPVCHMFVKEDGLCQIDLKRDSIIFATRKYERWEDFIFELEEPLSALLEIFKPSDYTRIGLRYTDLFVRSKLGLDDVPWSDLINKPFAGVLASEVGERVTGVDSIYELDLGDDLGKLRVALALVKNEESEICFLLDSDFHLDRKTPIEDAKEVLGILNENSRNLLHYAIKGKLHDAMEPMEP